MGINTILDAPNPYMLSLEGGDSAKDNVLSRYTNV